MDCRSLFPLILLKFQTTTGWWFQPTPSEKYELVSWDDEIPNMMGKIKAMFQTTNQTIISHGSPLFVNHFSPLVRTACLLRSVTAWKYRAGRVGGYLQILQFMETFHREHEKSSVAGYYIYTYIYIYIILYYIILYVVIYIYIICSYIYIFQTDPGTLVPVFFM